MFRSIAIPYVTAAIFFFFTFLVASTWAINTWANWKICQGCGEVGAFGGVSYERETQRLSQVQNSVQVMYCYQKKVYTP